MSVTTDMTGGIIDRFRSLDVGGSSVLAGHVAASVVRNLASTVLVFGVAFLIGFRPSAGPLDWLAAAGILVLFILAISWLSAAFGLLARSPEAAGGFSFLVMFLPYPSSAFVPIDTMPSWLQGFASQPAGHPDHRDPARPAPRPPPRLQPLEGGGLVPGHPGRLGGRLRRPVPPPHHLSGQATSQRLRPARLARARAASPRSRRSRQASGRCSATPKEAVRTGPSGPRAAPMAAVRRRIRPRPGVSLDDQHACHHGCSRDGAIPG